ncbi:MAG: PD-(D/E)XK nuclease domain-containing protein [Polyangiaceae bacterium]|nr:PD-(D/E)XK nuclease domain-containing protein [Polyangiaceae bacterium]
MFSGLNNIEVFSILTSDYATAFGFTEEEVATLVSPSQLEEVRTWYNGYLFGGQVIYNPWSILNYVKKGEFHPYWVNTSSTDLIDDLATKHGMGLSPKSAALLNGEAIETRLDDNIVLRDVEHRVDAFWNFLLFSGYLKLVSVQHNEGRTTGLLSIPNKEIRVVYQLMFERWFERAAMHTGEIDALVTALFSGDAAGVETYLSDMLLRIVSYQDGAGRQPENLYHGFVLGLLVHLEAHYQIRSNREAGLGRADVLMLPKTKGRPAVVMEFKVPFGKETPEQAMQKALNQIGERKYAAELEGAAVSAVHEYAMVFDGKQVWVRRGDDAPS